MDNWYPRLEGIDVPVPETEQYEIRSVEEATAITEGVPTPQIDFHEVADLIESVDGPPAFLRTDQASGKHRMDKASQLVSSDLDDIEDTVFELLQHNEMAGFAGLPYTSLYVREWLDLESAFDAFSWTPIASEVRVFIDHGEVHDYGFYWPADALSEHSHHRPSLPDEWRAMHADLKKHALDQVQDEVLPLAEIVADEFDDDYWSVDFAETEDGDWYAIDMALGVVSWHPGSVDKPERIQSNDE